MLHRYNVSSGWIDEVALTPSPGAVGQLFGYNVCVRGSLLLGGAPSFGAGGAAYVFQNSGSGWNEVRQLLSSTAGGQANDRMGETVGLGSDAAFIGALGEDHPLTPGEQHGGLLIFSDVPGCNSPP